MKGRLFSYTAVLILFLALGVGGAQAGNGDTYAGPLAPLRQAFTYQGQLKDSAGNPINDNCDFLFKLYDAEAGGAQVGPNQEKTAVSVEGGYFKVVLDFSGSAFLGEARWLEVGVRCPAGGGVYTTLSPRQALTPAPYALDADLLDGQHGSAYSSAGHTHWGQTWTGSGTGLTLSGGTTGISGSGSTYGVYGTSGSTTGAAGYFSNISGSGAWGRGWGVRSFTGSGVPDDLHPGGSFYPAAGEFAGPNGVIGAASSDAIDGYGVIGISAGMGGRGVYGYASDANEANYGVYGLSNSIAGTGVMGTVDATSGDTFGVRGLSSSVDGTGVYGRVNASTGANYGVYGLSSSTSGTGVYGHTDATSGTTYGVFGLSDSSTGIGVYGYTSATTGSAHGVVGYTLSVTGSGLYGHADNNDGTTTAGAYGRSDSGDGFGVAGHNYFNGVGVGAWSYQGNLIEAYSGDYPGGNLQFYITGVGNVYANGTYNTFRTNSLDGATYATSALQSTEVWLEDFGNGNLVNGIAIVSIAPDFAGIANLSVEYMVFVSLEGDCQGVYITNKTPTSFEVHELNGGTSNVPFSYRIVAKQAGTETVRLPEVTIPATVDVPRQPDEGTQPVNPPQAPEPVEQGQTPDQVQP
jgi:hypothetical protein